MRKFDYERKPSSEYDEPIDGVVQFRANNLFALYEDWVKQGRPVRGDRRQLVASASSLACSTTNAV